MAILLSFVLCAIAAVHGSILRQRAMIPPNSIVGLPEMIPDNAFGKLYKTYQPYLEVRGGCVPYPAVDANGNTNEGLPVSDSPTSGCTSSKGQIYVRGTDGANGTYRLMYSWYTPKDSPKNGDGHRNDLEGVIIALASSASTSASNVIAVCPSAHGNWECSTTDFTLAGTNPLIAYFSEWPFNFQMGLTDKKGVQQPLVAWESLPAPARNALQTADFGTATVPFKDGKFEPNIAEAVF